ncbi:hypothetical protein DZB84_09560 [Bacillus sp. HNG]|nr:hypothetical protein DZB84_09560 [Bacillus sp. HNG]
MLQKGMAFIKTFLSMLHSSKIYDGYYWDDPLEGKGDNTRNFIFRLDDFHGLIPLAIILHKFAPYECHQILF